MIGVRNKETMRPARNTSIELVGLPGTGKTTLAQSIKDRMANSSQPVLLTKKRYIRSWPYYRLIRNPAQLLNLLIIRVAVFIAAGGSLQYRARRAQKIAHGLTDVLLVGYQSDLVIFHEGPINWLCSTRWKAGQVPFTVIALTTRCYVAASGIVIHLVCDEREWLRRVVKRTCRRLSYQHLEAQQPLISTRSLVMEHQKAAQTWSKNFEALRGALEGLDSRYKQLDVSRVDRLFDYTNDVAKLAVGSIN